MGLSSRLYKVNVRVTAPVFVLARNEGDAVQVGEASCPQAFRTVNPGKAASVVPLVSSTAYMPDWTKDSPLYSELGQPTGLTVGQWIQAKWNAPPVGTDEYRKLVEAEGQTTLNQEG